MADSTTIQFTGDTADLQRKMDKMDKTNLRMIKRLREMGKASKTTGDVMKRSYRGSAEKLQVLNRVIAKQEKLIKNSGKASIQAGRRLKAWRLQSKALERQLNRTTISVKHLSSEANKTSGSMKDMGKSSNRMVQGITRGLGSLAAGWLSINGGIRIANVLMQKQMEMIDRRAEATKTFQEGLGVWGTLGDNAKNMPALEKAALGISARTGVKPVPITELGYSVQSNAAELDHARMLGAVETAANIKKLVPAVEGSDIGTMLGKALSANPKLSVKEAGDIVMFAIDRAGVGKAAEVAGGMPKAAVGGLVGDTSVRDAVALFTVLSRVTPSADVAGAAVERLNRRLMLSDPDALEVARQTAAGVAADPGKRKEIKGRQKYFAEAGILESDDASDRLDKLAKRNADTPYTMDALNTIFGGRTAKHAKLIFSKHAALIEERRLFDTKTAKGQNYLGVKYAQLGEYKPQAQRQTAAKIAARTVIAQQDASATHQKLRIAMAEEINAGSSDSAYSKWARLAGMKADIGIGEVLGRSPFARMVDEKLAFRQATESNERELTLLQSRVAAGEDVGPSAGGGGASGGLNVSERLFELMDKFASMTGGGSPLVHTEPVAGGAP